jgi:GntR family transcriptional regulator, rspAB operon transcriptional repressor
VEARSLSLFPQEKMAAPKNNRPKRLRGSLPGRVSQAERAYLEIRNDILKGTLPVGMALSRRSLAAELGISVPPVTEALLRLQVEGLIESKPRVGTRVRIPSPVEARDRALLREALEGQAARLFAERATAAEKRELLKLGRKMDQLYAQSEREPVDRELLFAVNMKHKELHLRIAECARCQPLRDAIEKEQVLIFNWLYDTAAERRKLGADFHSSLTAALAEGTPQAADAAMRRHIRRGLDEVLAGLERYEKPAESWRAKSGKR